MPTTIILDRDSRLRRFNPGYVTADILKRQIADADDGRPVYEGRQTTDGYGGYYDSVI
jgi:hypothetical protein